MKTKAFTLIELLVVVAIIGILAAVGVVAYNGYTASAKKKAIIHQHNEMRNLIQIKFTQAELRMTPDIEIFANGVCHQHFIPGNALLGSKPTLDITQLRAMVKTGVAMCDATPSGTQEIYYQWMWGIGKRNILNKEKRALNQLYRETETGSAWFACGGNAGYSDDYKCILKSKLSDTEYIEDILYKSN